MPPYNILSEFQSLAIELLKIPLKIHRSNFAQLSIIHKILTAMSNISSTYLCISNKTTFLRKMRMFNIVFNFPILTIHCLVHLLFKMLHIEVTFP